MTYKDKRTRIKDRRLYWLRKIKKSKGCENCGYDKNPLALDFAHIDPLTKHEAMCTYEGTFKVGTRGLGFNM